ncbi:hypothetical protein JSY14_04680 [Brachybacterium sp. EF45031]|uniref:sterol carrier family protein n=1 Tax=Brachybacterium sillae TaxID=2810536 RepID=UPI00217D3F74|nr:sterol carrier family protein [Brachybacterium sillae]MCS6711346.1 hypothetical protein [Brachybacterium sillae]
MPARRTDPEAGRAALARWAREGEPERPERRTVLGAAVRHTLALLEAENPGRAVEVRVPPYGAVQILAGVSHTRGTPPAVVETDPLTWLALAVGDLDWDQARRSGALRASGERSDLSPLLPLPGARRTAAEARA